MDIFSKKKRKREYSRREKKKAGKGSHARCHLSSSEFRTSRGLKTDPLGSWPHILFSIWGLFLL
jgi:hypothetical protein